MRRSYHHAQPISTIANTTTTTIRVGSSSCMIASCPMIASIPVDGNFPISDAMK